MKHFKSNSKIKKLSYILLSMALILSTIYLVRSDNDVLLANNADSSEGTQRLADFDWIERDQEPYYYEMQQDWETDGLSPGTDQIEIDMTDYSDSNPEANITVDTYGGESDVLLWSGAGGWVEYEVEVEEEGLYNFGLDYFPLLPEDGGSNQSVIFSVAVNGEFPFLEARSIEFAREFRDTDPQFDDIGNQVRSLIDEVTEWKSSNFIDSNGASVAPLQFHLNEGTNTIRLYLLREGVALDTFTIDSPKTYDSYEDVRANFPADATTTGDIIDLEAEAFETKSSTSIQVQYDRDPLTTPESLDRVRFNTLGGASWSKENQSITWEIDVPEDGEYKIGFRGLQNFQQNLTIHRAIYIDGEIPFEELKNYQIPYASGWQETIISDESDEPYSIYLEEGTHTITMAATHEPYIPLLVQIDTLTEGVRVLAEELRVASGGREDSFRVWQVERELPGLVDRLAQLGDQFANMADQMIEINGQTNSVSQSFSSMARDVDKLLDEPNEIPNNQVTIGRLQEMLSSQREELLTSPLQIDTIYFAPIEEEFPRMTSRWYEKIMGTYNSLVYSFSGQNELAEQEEEELNIWMMWGRDYAEELQQLADQQFTPEHGVRVNVNLIQDSNLLILAKAAGIMPDVALGIPSSMPFEMALRGAALDFTTMPGYEEVIDNYAPGALLPYYYDEGIYGIPETMNFKVLFYRKDILDQLDLDIPDTWDDVYDMLPTLLQNQYNFFVDPQDFSYMLFQNGVELYTENGMRSGLDTQNAFNGFSEWTDLFNLHGLDLQVQSFYQQFRNGDFPIGIADFNQYMQLLVAAPEILDVWGIAPVPGMENPEGDIVRWAGGTGLATTSVMLFNDTPEEKLDQAWEFIKWYTSDETQTQYGTNLEQFRGETFRWNSANINAFAAMPWRPADLDVFLDQWRWVKDVPNVPGGYMTARHLSFAWNQVVLEGANPRIELEEAVQDINRELVRKQYEFGLIDEQGNVLHSLDVPHIKEPWEGVEQVER